MNPFDALRHERDTLRAKNSALKDDKNLLTGQLQQSRAENERLTKVNLALIEENRERYCDIEIVKGENERLKLCLEPGKASAIVDGMFREAVRLGFYKPTAEPALSQFVREVETQRANLALLKQIVEFAIKNISDDNLTSEEFEAFHEQARAALASIEKESL